MTDPIGLSLLIVALLVVGVIVGLALAVWWLRSIWR